MMHMGYRTDDRLVGQMHRTFHLHFERNPVDFHLSHVPLHIVNLHRIFGTLYLIFIFFHDDSFFD